MSNVLFFYGAASGGSRKALQMLQEPNVMISYATRHNTPWYGINRLFVDCGGYTLLKSGVGHSPIKEYVDYLRRWQPELYALRDYPCEPDLLDDLGETVESHQEKTIQDHKEMVDKTGELDGKPVSVLQGWETSDYLHCIDRFREQGIPMNYVGVGSVCRRNAEAEIRDVLRNVRAELPDAHIHAFGVKTSVLSYSDVPQLIDSADSLAYSYAARAQHGKGDWKTTAMEYLKMRNSIQSIETKADDQTTLDGIEQ